jgi:UDP-2-acetamido-3-amino-2,3-dideoxy-glucuronate N-acetyltransferase
MNLVRTCAELGVLAAVCDPDLHPLEEVRSRFEGVRVFCDYRTMLHIGKLDAVVVASPAPDHAEMALLAIEAGLDVMVEKPLALNVADAQRVVDAAARARAKLAVGHVLLYHPGVRLLLKAIEDGRIGDVRYLRSRRLSWGRLRAHEDVWWSFAPHDVAVMLAVFGEEPSAVRASTGAYVRPHIADVAHADFTFSAGRTAHIEVSWTDPEKTSRVDVFGSQGVLTFSDSRAGARLTLTPCGDRLNARGEPELWRADPIDIDVPAAQPLALEVEAFCRYVRGGKAPPTDGAEGLAVVRALSRVSERPPSTAAADPFDTRTLQREAAG